MADNECEECSSLMMERNRAEREAQHLDGKVSSLECKIEELLIEVDQLTTNIGELSEYVKDLETALAEAHLMSKEELTK
jgi:peptidoglycan hydrolase CwlO-like protein